MGLLVAAIGYLLSGWLRTVVDTGLLSFLLVIWFFISFVGPELNWPDATLRLSAFYYYGTPLLHGLPLGDMLGRPGSRAWWRWRLPRCALCARTLGARERHRRDGLPIRVVIAGAGLHLFKFVTLAVTILKRTCGNIPTRMRIRHSRVHLRLFLYCRRTVQAGEALS